jgi:hypothetical protein
MCSECAMCRLVVHVSSIRDATPHGLAAASGSRCPIQTVKNNGRLIELYAGMA